MTVESADVVVIGSGGFGASTAFHLVERGFGRFARAVRLGRPCDASRATARLANGELRVTVPKIAERRGKAIPIQIREAGEAG